MPKTEEGKVKQEVTKLLKSFGSDVHFWMPVPNGFGTSGLDYHGVVRGIAFVVETKAYGKMPTKRQESFMRYFTMAGGHAFVVTGRSKGDLQLPRGLGGLERWINEILSSHPKVNPSIWR